MKTTTLVGIALGIIAAASITTQFIQSQRFMQKGPRFTAQDGQHLCERIQHLEQASRLTPGPCHYYSLPAPQER